MVSKISMVEINLKAREFLLNSIQFWKFTRKIIRASTVTHKTVNYQTNAALIGVIKRLLIKN